MKLRNKKTGEIGYLIASKDVDKFIMCNEDWFSSGEYESLTELNEDWEDYEEPKEYWYMDINGEIMYDNVKDDTVKVMREIGNYFNTKEEAEKAVEKLKAWKRLKDNGFKFRLYLFDDVDYNGRKCEGRILFGVKDADEKDLDLLFGGEE